MTRDQAVDAAGHAIYAANPERSAGAVSRARAAEIVLALEAVGLIKFEEPKPAYTECDCDCAAECPQGRVGSQRRCRIPTPSAKQITPELVEQAVMDLPSDYIQSTSCFSKGAMRRVLIRRICAGLGLPCNR